MGLVAQWGEIFERLPEGWEQVRLRFSPADPGQIPRAASLLAPLSPGRAEGELRFAAFRVGTPGPELVRRLLARLDAERIGGRLALVEVAERPVEAESERRTEPLAQAWDRLVAQLPEDWSDLLCHLELRSSDDLDTAARLLAPLNPARHGRSPGFRFRVARRFGYGAAPQMARRCLARLDEEGIRGTLRLLDVLSGTQPVATQGPVWIVGGRAV